MNITLKSQSTKDSLCKATVVIASDDVNAAIKKAYKDIAQKYRFQGFRKGRAPRPVIDSMIGKSAVLADATNDLVRAAEPFVLEKLNIVPLEDPNYGDEKDARLLQEGSDFSYELSFKLRPSCKLKSYDAPSITMPPSEVTENEIEAQIQRLLSYHTSYEDETEARPIAEGDIIQIDVENIENAEPFVGKNRMLSLNGQGLPTGFEEGLVGMKAGETKEISFSTPFIDNAKSSESTKSDTEDDKNSDANKEDQEKERIARVKVTVQKLKKTVVPELNDDFAKKSFGFDTVADLREAISKEIEAEKKNKLPSLKEDRLVEALAKELELDELPQAYEQQVFNELAQSFLNQLQSQGTTLDAFLSARGIQIDAFIADLHNQAAERARQSLALDALADKLGFEASQEDLDKEFAEADPKNAKKTYKKFLEEGRLPAVRESIRRSKALKWMLENAQVSEVDESAKNTEKSSASSKKTTNTKKTGKSSKASASDKKKSSAKTTAKASKDTADSKDSAAKLSSKTKSEDN